MNGGDVIKRGFGRYKVEIEGWERIDDAFKTLPREVN